LPTGSADALAIAALTAGSSSCDQLALLNGRMFLPFVEVLDEAGVRADRDLRGGHGAELRVDDVQRRGAELDLEAELLELRLGDLAGLLGRVGVRGDHQQRLAARPAARGVDGQARIVLPGREHVLARHGEVAARVGQEVGARALLAARRVEAGEVRRQEVRGELAGRLAAPREPQREAIGHGHDRLADVDVVERLDV
jgi:hypothetical protein